MAKELAYRRDIDGLRALAVLAIVIFHASAAWVPGGFIGVDIFFVISGYLITGIVAGQRDEGRFSFTDFYLRRARRILPAYLAIAACVSVLALWVLLPKSLVPFGASLAASGLFLTNLWFTQGFGYFAAPAQVHPLLHLWSLGVEEQFYLVWPLLLVGLSIQRLRRTRLAILIGLAVLSLALAQWLVMRGASPWAFFLFPTRAWEFMLGGIVAMGAPRLGRRAAETAAAGGVVLVAGSLAFLSEATPFPGLSALPACLGAGLLLWSGKEAEPLAAAPLRSAPAVWIGRLSYSLYLWHWPLLVLTRQYLSRMLTTPETLAILGVSFVLAILTWRFVEQPWRKRPINPRRRTLALALSPLLLMVAAGALMAATAGLPGRLSPAARHAASFAETDINPARGRCFAQRGLIPDGCRFGAPDAAPYDVLVWGDSHADAVTPGVVAWAQGRGWSVREATKGGCPPLVDALMMRPKAGPDRLCVRSADLMLKEIAGDPQLKLIVLSARWPLYMNAQPAYDPDVVGFDMADARNPKAGVLALAPALDRTLDAIAATGTKAQVVVIGPVPELTFAPPACVAQALHVGRDPHTCWDAPAGPPLARARLAEAQISLALARHSGVRAIFPAGKLCAEATCVTVLHNTLLYFDDDHLSASGARMLIPGWLNELLGIVPAPTRK